MSSQKIKKSEDIYFSFKNNQDKDNQNGRIKKNHNFIFSSTIHDSNIINSQNEYIETNTRFIQKEPIINQDSFYDILNKFKDLEINNNTSLNHNKNNKITLKPKKQNSSKNIFGFNSNGDQYINDNSNSNKEEQIEILKNRYNNNDKKIEIINIQNNNPKENSFNNNSGNFINNNTINTLGNDEEENNIVWHNQNMNNIFLNQNKNNTLDIDVFSENNSNCQDIKISNEIQNNDMFITFHKNNNNQNNFLASSEISEKINYSAEKISPFNKREITFIDNSNIIKENFLSPINNEISPIIKSLNRNDLNEKNNNNKNKSILNKNSFNQLISLITQKEKEYIDKNGTPEHINPIKNFPIKLTNNEYENNKEPLKHCYKNDTFFKDKKNINNENIIINNSDELSTKIRIIAEVKPLPVSSDEFFEDDNNINQEQLNIICSNNIKEIPQEKEYQITNISSISNLNFRKIIGQLKFNQLIEQIKEKEIIAEEDLGIEENEWNEYNHKNIRNSEKNYQKEIKENKKKIIDTIKEDENESKYDQDSLKNSRKNSKKKLIKIEDKNKRKNSLANLDKNNSQNYEISNNIMIALSSPKVNKNLLSISAKNLTINNSNEQYSTPNNKIKAEKKENLKNQRKENSNKDEVKNVEFPDFNEFFNAEKINKDNKEGENIKKNIMINMPKADKNQIIINKFILNNSFKEIDEKFKRYMNLIDKENKDRKYIKYNSNLNINPSNSLNDVNKNKPNYLFENIIKTNDNNINNIKKYNIDTLFNKPYDSYNKDNSLINFGKNESNVSNFNLNTNNFDDKNNINKSNNKNNNDDEEEKEEILSMKSNGLNNNKDNNIDSLESKIIYTDKYIINNAGYNPFSEPLNNNYKLNLNDTNFKNNENNNNENELIKNNQNNNKNDKTINGNENYYNNNNLENIILNNSKRIDKNNKTNNDILLSNISKTNNYNNIKDDKLKQNSNKDSNNILRKSQQKNEDENENSKEYDFDIDEDNDFAINNFNNNKINGIIDIISEKDKNENIKNNKNENIYNNLENKQHTFNNIESNHDTKEIKIKNDNHSSPEKFSENVIFNISNNEELRDCNHYIPSPEFTTPIKEFDNKPYNSVNFQISNLFENKKTNQIIRKINLKQILNIQKLNENINIKINNEEAIKDFLNYIIIDKKNNKILFTKDINKINKKSCIPIRLISYLLILNKINMTKDFIFKIKYESLIKKLIIKTNEQKQVIKISNNNSSNIIPEENDNIMKFLFKNFMEKIKMLKESASNKENYNIIPEKREELKNIYTDLIKYINKVYKNSPGQKIACYQKVIDYLKEFKKEEDDNIKYKKSKSNKNGNFEVKPKTNDKNYKKAYLIGGILIPLFYIINFFLTNLK